MSEKDAKRKRERDDDGDEDRGCPWGFGCLRWFRRRRRVEVVGPLGQYANNRGAVVESRNGEDTECK